MASATRRLLLQSRRSPSPLTPRSPSQCTSQWQRPFSTTPRRAARDPYEERETERVPLKAVQESTWANTPDKAAAQLQKLAADLKELNQDAIQDAARRGRNGREAAMDYELDADEDLAIPDDDLRAVKNGFWAEGEESLGPDEDYYGDDITSHGHGELQSHRYLREYARLIAWELPLLSDLARPFSPPTAATPFRFRYTSYLGESHPATNKVVVQFSPSDLGLTPLQRAKLIKLAGPRYNPASDLIKLATEAFDTQTQNKRFLGDTISNLVAEAKDATDTFEDVPFDFRHHTPKVRHEFPKEWILTPERKKYLADKRAEAKRVEDGRRGNGEIVDGQVIVETSLPFAEAEPVLVEAPRRK